MGDEDIIESSNAIIDVAFRTAIGNALDGIEVRFVPNFKKFDNLPPLQTYGTMISCTMAELPDACAALGRNAAHKLRSLIDDFGKPVRVVTFLDNTPTPRVDGIQRDGDRITLRGYCDVGISG